MLSGLAPEWALVDYVEKQLGEETLMWGKRVGNAVVLRPELTFDRSFDVVGRPEMAIGHVQADVPDKRSVAAGASPGAVWRLRLHASPWYAMAARQALYGILKRSIMSISRMRMPSSG
jgi:hypothetical protein